MSLMVAELYDALRKAGVDDVLARQASEAVMSRIQGADLVTKADLRAEVAELKADLIKWNVGAIIAMTALFAGIVKLT